MLIAAVTVLLCILGGIEAAPKVKNPRNLVDDGRVGGSRPREVASGELAPVKMLYNAVTKKWDDYDTPSPSAASSSQVTHKPTVWSRLHRYAYAPGNAAKFLTEQEQEFYSSSPLGETMLEIRTNWESEHASGETSGLSYISVNQDWAGFENFVLK